MLLHFNAHIKTMTSFCVDVTLNYNSVVKQCWRLL